MEDIVKQRVNEFRKHLDLSVLAFSKAIGIGQTTLNQQLMDGKRSVSVSVLLLILKAYPNLSAEWLLRGDGMMERNGTPSRNDTETINDLRDNITALKEVNALLREKIARLEGEKDNVEGDRLLSVTAQGKVKMLGGEWKDKVTNVKAGEITEEI